MSFAVIISPAKKMNIVEGPPWPETTPVFLDRTAEIAEVLRSLSYEEAKAVWACSDALAELNYDRHQHMDLARDTTAAILAYEGIQYQNMAPSVLDTPALTWLNNHLRIISGFYGVVRPSDGIVPYRLEMQAKLCVGDALDLYNYWGDALTRELARDFEVVVNCASVEYAKAVLPHAKDCGLPTLTCLFCTQLESGKLTQRSTEAKAARGTFVRWCAENEVESISDLQNFSERGYAFSQDESTDDTLTFIRPTPTKQ